MNTEYEANKIKPLEGQSTIVYFNNNPYVVWNGDYSKKYQPNQYCTVLVKNYDYGNSSSALTSMSIGRDMEILNLPSEHFKRTAMEMLIKEIMANFIDMARPFDEDYKRRAFFAMIIDVAHRVSYLSQYHNAFIINSDAGMIEYSEHNRFYLRSDTSIKKLGYDTASVESVFEYELFDRSITVFTLDEKKHPEGRNAIIVIINLKEDD